MSPNRACWYGPIIPLPNEARNYATADDLTLTFVLDASSGSTSIVPWYSGAVLGIGRTSGGPRGRPADTGPWPSRV